MKLQRSSSHRAEKKRVGKSNWLKSLSMYVDKGLLNVEFILNEMDPVLHDFVLNNDELELSVMVERNGKYEYINQRFMLPIQGCCSILEEAVDQGRIQARLSTN